MKGRYDPYTFEEYGTIIENWTKMSTHEIAKCLNRPEKSISSKVCQLRKRGFNLPIKKTHNISKMIEKLKENYPEYVIKK